MMTPGGSMSSVVDGAKSADFAHSDTSMPKIKPFGLTVEEVFDPVLMLMCSSLASSDRGRRAPLTNHCLNHVRRGSITVHRVMWRDSLSKLRQSKEMTMLVCEHFRMLISRELSHELRSITNCRAGAQAKARGVVEELLSSETLMCDYSYDTSTMRILCHDDNDHIGRYLEMRNYHHLLGKRLPSSDPLTGLATDRHEVRLINNTLLDMLNLSCYVTRIAVEECSQITHMCSSSTADNSMPLRMAAERQTRIPMDGVFAPKKVRHNSKLMRSCLKVEYDDSRQTLVTVHLRLGRVYVLSHQDNRLIFTMPIARDWKEAYVSLTALCAADREPDPEINPASLDVRIGERFQEDNKSREEDQDIKGEVCNILLLSVIAVVQVIEGCGYLSGDPLDIALDTAAIEACLKMSSDEFVGISRERVMLISNFLPYLPKLSSLSDVESFDEDPCPAKSLSKVRRFYVLNEDFRTLLIPHRADLPAATLDSCKNLYAHASEMMFPTPPSGRMSSVRVLDSRKKDLTIMGGEFMRLTERMACNVPSSFVLLVSSRDNAYALSLLTTSSEVGSRARYEPPVNKSLELRNLMGQILSCRASEVPEEVEAFAHSSRGRVYFMTSNVRDIIDAELSSIAKKHRVTVLYLGAELDRFEKSYLTEELGLANVTDSLLVRPPVPWIMDTSVPADMVMECYCTENLACGVGLDRSNT